MRTVIDKINHWRKGLSLTAIYAYKLSGRNHVRILIFVNLYVITFCNQNNGQVFGDCKLSCKRWLLYNYIILAINSYGANTGYYEFKFIDTCIRFSHLARYLLHYTRLMCCLRDFVLWTDEGLGFVLTFYHTYMLSDTKLLLFSRR